MIPISKPSLTQQEIKAVTKVLKSAMIASGDEVAKFEQEFAEYVGVKYAVATSSGTSALHLAMLTAGISDGDEVITTPFSFLASSNCISYVKARPVFADIEKNTFNIVPQNIEKNVTKKTKAILPVHMFGLPANMPEINKIAKKHNLLVIEDAAQAHGASIHSKKIGALGDMGCFSFYATKNMTTGEGGMITTNNKKHAQKAIQLRNHGMIRAYMQNALGMNYQMTNIAAAIGRVQLRKLEKFNEKRIKNAKYLTKELSQVENVLTPITPKHFKHVFHQYTIRVSNSKNFNRNVLSNELKKNGITSAIFYPKTIPTQDLYKNDYKSFKYPQAEQATREVLSIPVHPLLSNNDLQKITVAIRTIVKKHS